MGLLSQSGCWKFESQFKLWGFVPESLHISAITDSTSSTNRQHHVKHVLFRTPTIHSLFLQNQEEGPIDETADRSWTERGRENERGRETRSEQEKGEKERERQRENLNFENSSYKEHTHNFRPLKPLTQNKYICKKNVFVFNSISIWEHLQVAKIHLLKTKDLIKTPHLHKRVQISSCL